MRPTLRLLLQRAWHAVEPVGDLFVRCLPGSVKLIMFRGLVKALRVRAVSVDGNYGRIQGDPLDLGVLSEYMLTGKYSPELVKFLQDWFKQFGHGTMIDVGANIGLTTAPIAMSGVACICFEPDANNFRLLQANTAQYSQNGLVKLFNVAIFDSDGEVSFEVSDWNHGDHRVRLVDEKGAFGEQHRRVTTVEARRLDNMVNVNDVRRPLFVKIDTQGGEAHALKGGETVVASADLLSLEFCPYLIRRAGQSEDTLIDFVEQHFVAGYIGNWHAHSEKYHLVEIDELVATLRGFSSSVNTTQHLKARGVSQILRTAISAFLQIEDCREAMKRTMSAANVLAEDGARAEVAVLRWTRCRERF
jgi:FkbM family methyltransferase